MGVKKVAALVVAYVVGWLSTLFDGMTLEVSSWNAHGRLDPKFAVDESASAISVLVT
jgi:hypothetical protein